jgi:hypothetical protein
LKRVIGIAKVKVEGEGKRRNRGVKPGGANGGTRVAPAAPSTETPKFFVELLDNA